MFGQSETNVKKPISNRVAVLGCGNVEVASVYSLLSNQQIAEIVLIGDGSRELLGKVNRLCSDFTPFSSAEVRRGTLRDLKDSRILIVATGTKQNAEESFLEMAERRVGVIRRLMHRVKRNGFNGIVIMTTTPVDLSTQAAQEVLGCEPGRVIGIGSTFPKASSSHGSERRGGTPVAFWCSSSLSDKQFMDACEPDCPYFEETLAKLRSQPERRRRSGGFEVATCVMRVCVAILSDEKAVFPVSTLLHGQYGISGINMNVPCVIGRSGVEQIVELPASEATRREMLDSAQFLRAIDGQIFDRPMHTPPD
jgi:L-lactate dehydrogenase